MSHGPLLVRLLLGLDDLCAFRLPKHVRPLVAADEVPRPHVLDDAAQVAELKQRPLESFTLAFRPCFARVVWRGRE